MQFLIAALSLWLSSTAKCDTVTVKVPSGVSYLGVRNMTLNQDIFHGIPYAKPPVGALRFQPPQQWTPANNNTLINATVDRPICVQSTPITYSDVSEDCLHISLWKPSNTTAKLPVMVWIYGGGFLNGSTLGYPGEGILNTAFQLGKPVVYVAMNYRLGIYGFPPGKQSEAAGALNLGLKDQRLALEWVKKNVGAFGGDPNRVMIFGESAGAMSVAYQMLYKDGNHGGVFRTALMESGAPSTYAALPASYPPRQAAYNFIANATGCAQNNFECLRNANADKLRQANYDVFKLPPNLRSPDPYPSAVGPTLSAGDPFLPRSPKLSIRQGKFAKIPFVCGTNLDEGTIFTTDPATTEDVVSFLTTQSPGRTFGITNKTAVNQLLQYYPADPSAGSPYNTGNDTFGKAAQYKRAASIICLDSLRDLTLNLFQAPRRDFLQVATKLGVSAWSYQWAQAGLSLPEFGVAHSFELNFVFQVRREGMTQPLIDLSVDMIDYWITLAYRLDPGATSTSRHASITWLKYGTEGKSLRLEAGQYLDLVDVARAADVDNITKLCMKLIEDKARWFSTRTSYILKDARKLVSTFRLPLTVISISKQFCLPDAEPDGEQVDAHDFIPELRFWASQAQPGRIHDHSIYHADNFLARSDLKCSLPPRTNMRFLSAALLLWLSSTAKCDTVTVKAPSGVSYLGVRNTTLNQDIFHGIPYAKPPVGALRFKPPQEWTPANNNTLINATVDRPICVQSTPITYSDVSEDCLHISLWKPSNITAKLPVMVWIYGGGFLNGSTLGYPGEGILNTAFQLGKPVVYVGMNYRLGIYGFPPGKQSEAAGALNLGLKDQRLALEWVKKNVGAFGGDPDRVMIFGESAGAMSVAYQMMYKDGNHGGVFRTALMESGAPSTYAALPASYPPRQAAYNFIANATGCTQNNFECLRNANADKLRQANYDVFKLPPNLRSPDPYPSAVGPTLSAGDPFLPRSPKLSIRQGKFAKVPFVCGTNLDEGTIFTTNPATTEDVVSFLTAQLPGLTFGITNKTAVNQLLQYYPADPSAGSPYNTGNDTFGKAAQYKRAASIIGDLAPRRDFLQVATKLGVSAWSYQWAQAGLSLPEFGAAHSFDLAFVFQERWEGMTQPLIDLSVEMIDYWITLAYRLDPGATSTSRHASITWPKYGTEGKSLRLEAGNTTVIRDDFRVAGMNYIRDNILT